MNLHSETIGDALRVEVRESRIDAAVAIEFRDELCRHAEDGPPRVILDLGGVGFLDSSGLGAIVGAMKLLAPDRRLELAGLSGAVERVLRLTHMDRVFVIHAGGDNAVGAAADAP